MLGRVTPPPSSIVLYRSSAILHDSAAAGKVAAEANGQWTGRISRVYHAAWFLS
jgi:hypothetical protein